MPKLFNFMFVVVLLALFLFQKITAMERSISSKTITLISCDNVKFEVDKFILKMSPHLKHKLISNYKLKRNVIKVDVYSKYLDIILKILTILHTQNKQHLAETFKYEVALSDIHDLYLSMGALKLKLVHVDCYVAQYLHEYFESKSKKKTKAAIEAFLYGFPKNVCINLAKQYFYQFGKIKPNQSSKKRAGQFLQIEDLEYGFSVQELLENNKVPNPYSMSPVAEELQLNGLKLNSLDGLHLIPNLSEITKLYLNDNQLTDINPDVFCDYLDLEVNLKNNPLNICPADIFDGYDLRKLTIKKNVLDHKRHGDVKLEDELF